MNNLQTITKHFTTEGTILPTFPYGSGHINDTYKVETVEPGYPNYILQRINHKIFKNPPEMMENIDRITRHIRMKLENTPGADPIRQGLTLIPTLDHRSFFQDPDGNFWRMYLFIEDNRSYDIVDTPAKAFEGGRMFGNFQSMIADLPGGPLHETIPNFHNIDMRLETLRKTIEKDPVGRVSLIADEAAFIWERAETMGTILHLGQQGLIPKRITHNDTKFNNVLLDKNDRGLCVIDLDTVMPGYVHYDFGDSIRTSTNTGAEDDPDLSKVEMDIRLFEAYTKGFLQETRSTLTTTELEYLPLAGKLFPYMIGVRFLTDFVDGDNYFKIKYEHHNLQRTRAQFKLLLSMESQFEEMKRIVKHEA